MARPSILGSGDALIKPIFGVSHAQKKYKALASEIETVLAYGASNCALFAQ